MSSRARKSKAGLEDASAMVRVRRQAARRLRAEPLDVGAMTPADMLALVHELYVHEAELEVQNEELRDAQLELEEARDRYRDLYEFAPVGYITVDEQHHIQYANRTAAALLHCSRGGLRGRRLEDLVAREHRDACYLHLRAACEGAEQQAIEVHIVASEETPRWLRLESMWRPASGSVPAESRVTLHDITARRRAEEALRRLNETLEGRVSDRTSMLKLLNDVAVASNRAETVEQAIDYALRRICEQFGWNAAQAYLCGEDDPNVLVPMRAHYKATPRDAGGDADAPGDAVRAGERPVGRAGKRRSPQRVNGFKRIVSHARAGNGRGPHVLGGAVFPIVAGSATVGVMEFFSDGAIHFSDRLLDTMAGIGTQLGHVVLRQRFENELARAVLAEQQRLGQDLHDTVGQEIAGLALITDRMARQVERGKPVDAAALHELSTALRRALADTRAVVRDLLPLDTPHPDAFVPALRALVGRAARLHGVACTLEAPDSLPIYAPDVAVHLYRIASEAVANSLRHAQAEHISARLRLTDGRLVLEVRDDGIGVSREARHGGSGLRIMRHRAHVIGGTLAIRRLPQGGTAVTCTVPRSRLRVPNHEEAGDGEDTHPDRR